MKTGTSNLFDLRAAQLRSQGVSEAEILDEAALIRAELCGTANVIASLISQECYRIALKQAEELVCSLTHLVNP